jgi:polyketide biosynthesis acyl carrier protein
MKSKEVVFDIIRDNIAAVLPSVNAAMILRETKLEELGADSVDRSDISIGAMEAVGLSLPLVELGKARNIGALVDLLHGAQSL